MRLSISVPLCAALAAVGCGGSTQQPPPVAAQPALPALPAADQPVAASPDYANWKRFKVGTAVTRKKVVANKSDAVTETTVLTLVELTDAKAVIEQQITVVRTGSPPKVNPAMRLDYPATFRVPPGLTAEQMSLPSLKAKKAGEETVKAAGQEYTATVYEWQDSTEAGPMATRAWLSDAVPGRLAKLESKVAGVGNSATEEVVEVKGP